MRYIIVVVLLLNLPCSLHGQSFVNGDLNGIIFGLTSLPDNWLAVPFTDPVCMATNVNCATPDLTDTAGPVVFLGIMGNPYAGTTFVSGEQALSNTGDFFHEGIRQAVHNLVPGNAYKIRFFQSVVKSSAALDQSGSWSVYADTVLLGVTTPSFSAEPFNSVSFAWELREISFVASQIQHQFKFLPTDDDTSHLVGVSLTGALRMGIDSIGIYPTTLSSMDEPGSLSFDIYPNPTKQFVNLSFAGMEEEVNLVIFDVNGRQCFEKNFRHTSFEQLSLNLVQGFYFIEVTTENRRGRQKIIID